MEAILKDFLYHKLIKIKFKEPKKILLKLSIRSPKIGVLPSHHNNILILRKNFDALSWEDIYTSRSFENVKRIKNIMWPISQSYFHVSPLCSLK